MKTSALAFAAIRGLVSAQNATVNNYCDTTVYVQSFPYDGSEAGPLTTVPSGGTFTEAFRTSGSTVKIALTRTLETPLFFGYSFSSDPDYAYCKYDLSNVWGNPFAADANSLSAGDGCDAFNCAANDASCYSSTDDQKTYACPLPVELTTDLCQ
ncbi:hypothetical protein N7493_001186 [Penicillium malachiteum]|uniref:Uncharacterized protein n=1 Tax=Penicillium malachiteum TaxID=1324776 RepID=A0AAD6N019_9EURO|nr:hypothetical protein N7493_001186 [Penicillium malachiteum]